MNLAGYITLLTIMGCNLAWATLDRGSVARSPLRISLVGLAICASGFFIQMQIHQSENLLVWILEKIPMLATDRNALDFF